MTTKRLRKINKVINIDRSRDKKQYKYNRNKFMAEEVQESLKAVQGFDGSFDDFIINNMHTASLEDKERVLEADDDIKLLIGASLNKDNINHFNTPSLRKDIEGFDYRLSDDGKRLKCNPKITIQDCIALNYHDPRNEYDSWIYNKFPKYLDFDKINWLKEHDDNVVKQLKKVLVTKTTTEQYKKAWAKVYNSPSIFISSEEEFNMVIDDLSGFIRYMRRRFSRYQRRTMRLTNSIQEHASRYIDSRMKEPYSEEHMDQVYKEYEALCKFFNKPDQIKNPRSYILENEEDVLGILSLAFGINGKDLASFNTFFVRNLDDPKDVTYYTVKEGDRIYSRPLNPQLQEAFNQIMVDFAVRDSKYGNQVMYIQTKPYENTELFNKLYRTDVNRIIEAKYFDEVEDMNLDQLDFAKFKDFCKFKNIKKM